MSSSQNNSLFDLLKLKLQGEEKDSKHIRPPLLRSMMCLCPVHEDLDSSPSLSVDLKQSKGLLGDSLLWKCFAGCAQAEVTEVINKIKDGEEALLKTPDKSKTKKKSYNNKKIKELIAQNKAYYKNAESYIYRDITGKPLSVKRKRLVVLRGEGEKSDKIISKTYVKYKVTNIRSLTDFDTEIGEVGKGSLYGLENLIKAQRRGFPFCIAEGEKDCDTVFRHTKIACCSSGNGANSWDISDCDMVLGKYLTEAEAAALEQPIKLFILQDADAPGRAGALMKALLIYERASQRSIPCQIRLVPEFPGGEDKKGWDVSDWFESIGHGEDAKKLFMDILKSTPIFNPEDLDGDEEGLDKWLDAKRIVQEKASKEQREASLLLKKEAAISQTQEAGINKALFSWPELPLINEYVDFTMAELLLRDYAHSLLVFVPQRDSWLFYDESRGVWSGEDIQAGVLCLKDLISRMVAAAEKEVIDAESNPKISRGELEELADLKSERLKFLKGIKSITHYKSILALASALKEFRKPYSEFDRDHSILAVKNGVLNLKDKSIRPFSSLDYITKQVDINYNPKAVCHRWHRFLEEILYVLTPTGDLAEASSKELRGFIKRLVGYCLTGSTEEQKFFMLKGEGNNGKSVFLNILQRHILKGLSVSVPVETVIQSRFRRKSNESTPELVALVGMRLCNAGEAPKGAKLDDSVLKDLTAGDEVSIKDLYKGLDNMQNTAKIFIRCNNMPKYDASDKGVRRRIVVVDFLNKIPDEEVDLTLERTLAEEKEGIFNWAVDGAEEWYANRLKIPVSCLLSAQQYADQNDPLKDFIDSCMDLGSGLEIERGEFYRLYTEWAFAAGEGEVKSARWVGDEMRQKGFIKDNAQRKILGQVLRFYSGIGIRAEGQKEVEKVVEAKREEEIRRRISEI
jgi:P4 family phage/plasmid primase-like protien